MNKTLQIFLLLFIVFPRYYCQSLEDIESNILKSRKYALENKLLSITVYKSKIKQKSKDSALVLSKTFDTFGNIIEIIDYHYKKNKDFEHRFYKYNTNHKRIEEFSKISFQKNYISYYYKYKYNDQNELTSMLAGSGTPNEIFFQEIKNKSDSLPKYVLDSSKYCKFDSLNRLIKETFDFEYQTEYEYNNEGSISCIKKYEEGFLWQILRFKENKLIEELSYYSRKKFWGHFKTYYKPNGLIDYRIEFNKREKPIKIERYHYQLSK